MQQLYRQMTGSSCFNRAKISLKKVNVHSQPEILYSNSHSFKNPYLWREASNYNKINDTEKNQCHTDQHFLLRFSTSKSENVLCLQDLLRLKWLCSNCKFITCIDLKPDFLRKKKFIFLSLPHYFLDIWFFNLFCLDKTCCYTSIKVHRVEKKLHTDKTTIKKFLVLYHKQSSSTQSTRLSDSQCLSLTLLLIHFFQGLLL